MTSIAMTTPRVPVFVTFGTAVTLALFWFMATTIKVGPVDTIRVWPAPPTFTPLIKDTPPQPRHFEKPAPPQTTEALPSVTFRDPEAGTSSPKPVGYVNVPVPPLDFGHAGRIPRVPADTDATPIVRPQPEFPASARTQGLEGWVMVEFTVTPSGGVADPHVVDAEPRNVFDDAALKAIARWKYNPRIDDGVAVERRGIRVLVRFDLED